MIKCREDWARDLGLRLTAAMKRRGLTQEALAQSLSITQAQVSRVLAGQFTPRSASAKALCTLLRVAYAGPAGRVPASRRRLERLSALAHTCSDRQVADLIAALTALQRKPR